MVLKRRHLAKAFTWRISATLITAVVTYIVTGQLVLALAIGAADSLIKFVWYYVHERLWHRSKWGIKQSSATMSEPPDEV